MRQPLWYVLAAAVMATALVRCGGTDEAAPRPNVAVFAPCLARQTAVPPPAPAPALPTGLALRLQPLSPVPALSAPLFAVSPPGDDARLFVVEQGGLIKVLNRANGSFRTTFLDLSAMVSTGGEQGVLGLAFDPGYGTNGRFYVNYTDRNGDSVIARFLRDDLDPDHAVPSPDLTILTVDQPFANHNGGMITFGPDGFLYVGFGDGGSAGDPDGRAQDLGSLLGKLLRIDVERAGPSPLQPYAVPASNPV